MNHLTSLLNQSLRLVQAFQPNITPDVGHLLTKFNLTIEKVPEHLPEYTFHAIDGGYRLVNLHAHSYGFATALQLCPSPRFAHWSEALPHQFANEAFMQATMMQLELGLAAREPQSIFDGDPRVHTEQVLAWNLANPQKTYCVGPVPQVPGVIKLGSSRVITEFCLKSTTLSPLYDDKSLLHNSIPQGYYAFYQEADGWTRVYLKLPLHYFECVIPPAVDKLHVISWIVANTFSYHMQEPLPLYLVDTIIKQDLSATSRIMLAATLQHQQTQNRDILLATPHRSTHAQ